MFVESMCSYISNGVKETAILRWLRMNLKILNRLMRLDCGCLGMILGDRLLY